MHKIDRLNEESGGDGESHPVRLPDLFIAACLGRLVNAFIHEIAQPINTVGLAAYNLQIGFDTLVDGASCARGLERVERIADQVRSAKVLLQKMASIGASLNGTAGGRISDCLSDVLDIWTSGLRNRGIQIRLDDAVQGRSLGKEADAVAATIMMIASLQDRASTDSDGVLRFFVLSVAERFGAQRIELRAEDDPGREILSQAAALARDRILPFLRRQGGEMVCRFGVWSVVLPGGVALPKG